MTEKILFVDDEASILEGYQRLLRRAFSVDIAIGAAAGIMKIGESGPYAVIISDMRMPGIDGIKFLTRIRQIAPETIRIMLTGYADIDTAVHAVNAGNIFRFLTKPASKETLSAALTAALEQYRLVNVEKELLEKTLSGSIKVLTEVLSLVNPAAFSRAMRIRNYVMHIVKRLGLPQPWRYEVAAMLSQLGCVTLPPETMDAIFSGSELSPEQQAQYEAHPEITRQLLSQIPRMEPVAWMISHQNDPTAATAIYDPAIVEESVRLGAQILRTALAFDHLIMQSRSKAEAVDALLTSREHSTMVVEAIEDVPLESEFMISRMLPLAELRPGMILNEDACNHAGLLVVARGQEITFSLLERIRNIDRALRSEFNVLIPDTPAEPGPTEEERNRHDE